MREPLKPGQGDDEFNSIGASLRETLNNVLEFLHLKRVPLEEQLLTRPHVSIDEVLSRPDDWKGKTLAIEATPTFLEDRSHNMIYSTVLPAGKIMIPQTRVIHVESYLYDACRGGRNIPVTTNMKIPEGENLFLIGRIRLDGHGPYMDLTEGWIAPERGEGH